MSKKLTPLRALFLSLSKMPPALMLLIIIVLAVMTTMIVTAKTSQLEAELEKKTMSPVVVARRVIPADTKIDRKMVIQKRSKEVAIFQDALTTIPNAVGRYTTHEIPLNAQIREVDLSF